MFKAVFSRRKFLMWNLLGVGGILGGTTFWSYMSRRYPEPLPGLGNYAGSVLFSFCEAILPESDVRKGVRRALRRLDEELFFVEESIRSDFNSALILLDLLPLKYGYFSRFGGLSPEVRRDFLKELTDTESDLERTAYSSLRMAVFMIYYGQEETWSEIGYEGPYTGKKQYLTESRKYYRELIKGN